MPDPDPTKIHSFERPEDLNRWLKINHAVESELWVKIYKKGSGKQSVTWSEIVIETLCWGWIDGIKKSLDEHAYLQRITPRRRNSIWSKRNTEHVERLIKEGRLKPPGVAAVDAAKEDGRWDNAYAPASEMEVPDDFLKAVRRLPNTKKFYDSLNKSNRHVIAYGLTSAKKPETRKRRFDKYLGMLKKGEKPSFY
ncbi:MAG: YdeI/OmpD-associated family protein [Verrucomicrobiota bacterium]